MVQRWIRAAAWLAICCVAATGSCTDKETVYIPYVSPDETPPTTRAIPPGGTYNSQQAVVLFTDEPATIYYTTDGSEPDEASVQYSIPIIIPAVEGAT